MIFIGISKILCKDCKLMIAFDDYVLDRSNKKSLSYKLSLLNTNHNKLAILHCCILEKRRKAFVSE